MAELQQAEEQTLWIVSGDERDSGEVASASEDAADNREARRSKRDNYCGYARLRTLHKARRLRQIERYFTTPPTSDKTSPYPAGTWQPKPLKPLNVGPDGLGEVVYEPSDDLVFMRDPLPDFATLSDSERTVMRADLLFFLQYTQSADDAWRAYSLLLDLPAPADGLPRVHHHMVPNPHLHRVARVIAHARPKTRTHFLRLLSVLAYLARQGGRVFPHEWNALIDGATKGWRTTQPGDVRLAFQTFADMAAGRAPGSSALADEEAHLPQPANAPTRPDIYTYTTLLSAAARTRDPATVRYATNLLQSSGLAPNRVTHLALLNYYTYTAQLSGVRATLRQLRLEGFTLGLDGLNAALWAFARNGRMDVVSDVYRVFRYRLNSAYDDADAIAALTAHLRDAESLDIEPDLLPNAATWTMLVQAFAHHGDLTIALRAFSDMLAQVNDEPGAPLYEDAFGKLIPGHYTPSMGVLRALFLGFARHGVPGERRFTRGRRAWTLYDLMPILKIFLALPREAVPSRSTIFWIMTAFRKTSGDEVRVLRRVWETLETRFGAAYMGSQYRLRTLRDWLYHEASEEGQREDGELEDGEQEGGEVD